MDLEISAIVVEELCGQEHVKVSSARAELKDIETQADEYSAAHLAILHFCSNGGTNYKENDDRRRRFLMRYKAVRNQLLQAIPEDKLGPRDRQHLAA